MNGVRPFLKQRITHILDMCIPIDIHAGPMLAIVMDVKHQGLFVVTDRTHCILARLTHECEQQLYQRNNECITMNTLRGCIVRLSEYHFIPGRVLPDIGDGHSVVLEVYIYIC